MTLFSGFDPDGGNAWALIEEPHDESDAPIVIRMDLATLAAGEPTTIKVETRNPRLVGVRFQFETGAGQASGVLQKNDEGMASADMRYG
ncbi:MAG: hypothetical protein AB7G13_22420 [Lautropia sp.]